MPIYEYQCDDCDYRFEVMQSATARAKRKCPECSGKLRKLFHPVGIIFKGSGWHITDYSSNGARKNGGATKEKSESKASSSDSDSSASTGDSKSKDAATTVSED